MASGGVSGAGMFALKWNHYQKCMTSGLAELLEDAECSMTDVTLACEGEFIQAHKIALAVSSPFFKQFFKMNRVEKVGTTLIALANVKFKDLRNIIQFIYHGEVHVSNADLSSFLAVANMLQIQGLGEQIDGSNQIPKFEDSNPTAPPPPPSFEPGRNPLTYSPAVQSDSTSTPPPPKRSRLATALNPASAIPHVDLPVSANVSLPPSSLEDYSSMHNEDAEEEEMISLDVKPEPIAVYSLEGNSEENYVGDGGFEDLDESSNERVDDKIGGVYDELVYGELSQTGQPGPSSVSVLSPFAIGSANSSNPPHKKPSDKRISATFTTRKSTTVPKTHGDAGEHYHSEIQAMRHFCLCETTFSTKGSLSRHIREMAGINQAKCNTCGKIFDRQRNLRRHQQGGACASYHLHT